MKKIDLDALLFVSVLNLKLEKDKVYSEDCDTRLVYIFNDYDEYKNYFINNGFTNISDDILETCRMIITKKGSVLALKKLCDYTIRVHNKTNGKEPFDILRDKLISEGKVSPNGCLKKRSCNGRTVIIDTMDDDAKDRLNTRICNSQKSIMPTHLSDVSDIKFGTSKILKLK